MEGARRLTAADAGNALHLFMQHADPARLTDTAYLEEFLGLLVEQDYLLPEEAALVELDAVRDFGESPLGQRLAKSRRIFREQPFNRRMEVRGSQVLVQGIMDCWFEEAGELVLLDYKTGRDRPDMDPRYLSQIRIYRDALAEAEGRPVSEVYLCHLPGRASYRVEFPPEAD
jgi:ATP-dependent helicase/nuclease subunit A